MNVKKTAIVLAMVSSFAAGSAMAKDEGHGTITFTGSIIDAPCSVAPGDKGSDQTIDLGEISNIALKDGGTSVPRKFTIELEQCDTTTLKTVQTTFTGTASTGNKDLLGIYGTAKGASVGITDNAAQLIKLGTPSPAQTLMDGNNTLAFSAYLQGDGASAVIVPGSFQAVANFTLSYQ